MSEKTTWAIEWNDGLGRSWWQPVFPNGQRLWWIDRGYSANFGSPERPEGRDARVYRSRWKAVRVAKARWRERQAEDLEEVQP